MLTTYYSLISSETFFAPTVSAADDRDVSCVIGRIMAAARKRKQKPQDLLTTATALSLKLQESRDIFGIVDSSGLVSDLSFLDQRADRSCCRY